MPAKETYSTVMITGASAFYAAAIMDRLLKVQPSIKIHATVRREDSAQPLRDRYGSSIKVFLVPDITDPKAFLEAVKGCDGILHVASPVRVGFNDAKNDMIDPAILGVKSAMEAAASEPKVGRIVLTSSIASMLDALHPAGNNRPDYTYTEADWNPLSTQYEKAITFTDFPRVYQGSKALAERAAWDFVEKTPRHFDLVAIHPVHTVGAYSQYVASPEAMNMTNDHLRRLIDGEEKEVPPARMPWITGVDEVAQAHVNALFKPEANGRYLIATSYYDNQQIVDLMHAEFADTDWIKNVPRGTPGNYPPRESFNVDNTRSRESLGVVYAPWQQAVRDFCKRYSEDRKRFYS